MSDRVRNLVLGLAAAALLGLGAVALAPGAPRAVAVAQDEPVAATDHTIVVVHVVQNGHPAAGRVTIRDEDGHEASCTVNSDGECEMQGIGAGRHVVEATAPDGTVSAARAVMIPEDGKVSLIVQLPAPNAAD